MEDRRDVRKRHAEHVVQHERQPLRRSERVEHHEQRKPDRVGDQRLLLRVDAAFEADDGVGHVDVRELFAPCSPGAQHVQAHAPDNGGQPGLHVLDAPRILVAEPKPCLLEGVVGFAHRPQHPVGNPPQMRTVLLKALRQPLAVLHGK